MARLVPYTPFVPNAVPKAGPKEVAVAGQVADGVTACDHVAMCTDKGAREPTTRAIVGGAAWVRMLMMWQWSVGPEGRDGGPGNHHFRSSSTELGSWVVRSEMEALIVDVDARSR